MPGCSGAAQRSALASHSARATRLVHIEILPFVSAHPWRFELLSHALFVHTHVPLGAAVAPNVAKAMESTHPPRRPKLDECRGLVAGSLGDGYGSLPDSAPVVHIKLPRQGAQRYHGLRNVTLLSFAVFGVVSIKLPSRHLKTTETDVDTTVLTNQPIRTADENLSATELRAVARSSSGRVSNAAVAAWRADANASEASTQNRSGTVPRKSKSGDDDGRFSKSNDKLEEKSKDDDYKFKGDDMKLEAEAGRGKEEDDGKYEGDDKIKAGRGKEEDDGRYEKDDKLEGGKPGDDDGELKDDGKGREALADDDGELEAKLKKSEEDASAQDQLNVLQHEQERRYEAERALEEGEAERELELETSQQILG